MRYKSFTQYLGISKGWEYFVKVNVNENGNVGIIQSFGTKSLDVRKKSWKKFSAKLSTKMKRREYGKKYRNDNKELLKEKDKKRNQNPLRREKIIAQVNKRRRNLSSNPLNKSINGIECDAHHVNEEEVVYIPAIIHRRIPHNLKTNKNMKLINSIAEGFK